MSLFPMFMKLEARKCLLVGAGRVAETKIESLLHSGAAVHVVASRATDVVRTRALQGEIHLELREFVAADLDGVFLVVVATPDRELNWSVFKEAQSRGVLCNVVDDPELCDFYYPAVVRRGRLQIAISTGGLSPALAGRLRRELESQFGPEWSAWVQRLGVVRRRLFERQMDPAKRRQLLRQLAERSPARPER